jgi:hypothetical protein
VRGQRWKLVGSNAAGRVADSHVGGGDTTGLDLAGDEALPGLSTLTDDIHGVALVLALAGESELVLGLAIGDLVDAEPLIGSTEKARQVAFDILDVVELGGQGVVHVNNDDLPVGLLLVNESHDAEDLDLLDLASVADELADLADIERVVVALGLGLRVHGVGVLPSLRESTIVPQVALVREAVANKSELALLDVLLDGVEELLLGDLDGGQLMISFMHVWTGRKGGVDEVGWVLVGKISKSKGSRGRRLEMGRRTGDETAKIIPPA